MRLPHQFINRNLFVIYGLVGLALIIYRISLVNSSARFRTDFFQATAGSGLHICKQWNKDILSEIRRKKEIYPIALNQDYQVRAEKIAVLAEKAEKSIRKQTENILAQYFPQQQLKAMADTLAALGNALHSLMQPDSTKLGAIQSLHLVSVGLFDAECYAQFRQEDAALLRDNLLWRIRLAQQAALHFLADRMLEPKELRANQFVPWLQTDSFAIARQPFHATLEVMGYVENNDLSYFVDGKPMKRENGRGFFWGKYNRPGRHRLRAEIQIFDSLNNTRKVYTREFGIYILKP